MPGCAAIGCNNRSEKGYSMRCFPREPKLRDIWKKRVGRANWEPSKNSFLCHMHFEPDQWTETENGRIKLKRDAMPSIFTETSTRKSPNKQRIEKESEELESGRSPMENRGVDESEDDNYTLEYLDDCEHEVTLASRVNGLKNSINDFANGKKNCDFSYHIVSERDFKGLEKENVIIVSDENNKEIGKLIHNNESIIIVADENNKEIGQIVVQENSLGQSNKHMDTKPRITHDDDIEEKMNQICNGDDDVTITRTEPKALEIKVEEDSHAYMTIVRSQGNISQELVSLDNGDRGNGIKEDLGLHGEIEDAKNEHKSNIEAAMRRQKKARKDVMKSIERTIAKLSEGTYEGVKNDQLTRSILSLTRARQKGEREKRSLGHKRSSEFELGDLHSSKKSKLTIKVTGIMEGLDNSRLTNRQEGSMISVKEEQSTDYNSTDFVEERLCGETNHRKLQDNQSPNIETLFKRNKDFIPTEEFDKQLQQRRKTSAEEKLVNFREEDMQSALKKYLNKTQDPNRDLKQKINAQQKVISKLTNQLIIYKSLEAKLAALNLQLKAKNKEIATLKGSSTNKESQMNVQETDEDAKEQTISLLTNRVNMLKEANKRLVQKIAVEPQDKKLGFHLKQKDIQIKELNWKLAKASKFLDRAEKNAITYKRKLVSLQTSIRRHKAAEERRNHFKELLIDNAKHEFSNASLLTALDIKKYCGKKCYEKLLSYDFPLPSLRTLRRRLPKEHIDEDDWIEEEELDEGGDQKSRDPMSIESTENEITGTVQDIFEENNDTEDLNSSEFGEHIFLQIEDEIKYEKT